MTTQERIDTNAMTAMAVLLSDHKSLAATGDALKFVYGCIAQAAYDMAEAMEAERGIRIASREPDDANA